MSSESLKTEDSRHESQSIMSVVLRRMCDAVESRGFGGRSIPSASFAPGNSLLAVHAASGELKVYTTLYYGETSGHLLTGLATGQVSKFQWTLISPTSPPLLTSLAPQSRHLLVYQILKQTFGPEEDVHLHTQAPNQDGEFFLRFDASRALKEDCNVVEYRLPLGSLFDGLRSRHPSLQAVGTSLMQAIFIAHTQKPF